jgi:hypothetical protein
MMMEGMSRENITLHNTHTPLQVNTVSLLLLHQILNEHCYKLPYIPHYWICKLGHLNFNHALRILLLRTMLYDHNKHTFFPIHVR